MDGTQPAASWRVRWPVLDDSWTLARLRAAALPEFHRLAARAGVLAVPPIAWAVEEDDAGLWLVGEAAAETLARGSLRGPEDFDVDVPSTFVGHRSQIVDPLDAGKEGVA